MELAVRELMSSLSPCTCASAGRANTHTDQLHGQIHTDDMKLLPSTNSKKVTYAQYINKVQVIVNLQKVHAALYELLSRKECN